MQNKLEKQENVSINSLQRDLLEDNFYIELQRINDSKLENFENELIKLAFDFKIPLIASNNIKFVNENDFNAHDALLCIAHKSTINQET